MKLVSLANLGGLVIPVLMEQKVSLVFLASLASLVSQDGQDSLDHKEPPVQQEHLDSLDFLE